MGFNIEDNVVVQVDLDQEYKNKLDEVVRKTTLKTEKFIATEGQTLFTLDEEYDPESFRIVSLEVGGVLQYSPENFTETSENEITLNEGVAVGTPVNITYFRK